MKRGDELDGLPAVIGQAGDHVPEVVLDELQQAFAGTVPSAPAAAGSAADDVTPVAQVTPAAAKVAPEPTPAAKRSTIVIGGTEDRPDTVYLDEATEPVARRASPSAGSAPRPGSGSARTEQAPGGGGTTIVLGNELDSSGAFDAVTMPARSMDPRVRERRAAVKKQIGRRRLIWIGSIVGSVLIVVAGLALLSSTLFSIERVDVQGATYSAARYGAQLQAVIDDIEGQPVLLVDTLKAERQLEQIPWVERAFVTTDFPRRALIDIRERVPLATFAGSDQRFRVIDRDGRVLDVLEGRPVAYMLLTGPAPDAGAGQFAGQPFAVAAQLVGALPDEIRVLTTSMSVDATTGDFGLVLTGDLPGSAIEVNLGGIDRIDSKLARLLQRVREGLDGIIRIDVSTDGISVTQR